MKKLTNSGLVGLPATSFVTAALIATLCGCGSKSGSKSEATIDELNRAMAVMSMSGKVPQNVYELTNFPALQGKSLPTPPAGKKLVIDAGKRQVVFADQ